MSVDVDADKLVRLAALRAELRALETELGLTLPPSAHRRDTLLDAAAYALVMEFSSDAVSVHSADGRYQFVSPAVEQILGFRPEQLVGVDPYGMIHPDDLRRVAESHAQQWKGTAQRVEYRLQCADGSWRWVETFTRPRVDESGLQQIICSTRDISDRRRAAEQQDELIRRLETFASMAAHDLKAPLQAISGLVDVVRWGAGERLLPDEHDLLERAAARTVRLGELVDGLLLFSRMDAQQLDAVPVDLAAVTQRAIRDLQGEIERNKATVSVIAPLPRASGDPILLEVLIQNLLSNAIKYRRDDVLPHIRIEGEAQKGAVVLRMSDNGMGISAADQQRVFDMFTRTEAGRSLPGSGVGLALCRRIVLHHGGEIGVESVPGHGATFSVRLPSA